MGRSHSPGPATHADKVSQQVVDNMHELQKHLHLISASPPPAALFLSISNSMATVVLLPPNPVQNTSCGPS